MGPEHCWVLRPSQSRPARPPFWAGRRDAAATAGGPGHLPECGHNRPRQPGKTAAHGGAARRPSPQRRHPAHKPGIKGGQLIGPPLALWQRQRLAAHAVEPHADAGLQHKLPRRVGGREAEDDHRLDGRQRAAGFKGSLQPVPRLLPRLGLTEVHDALGLAHKAGRHRQLAQQRRPQRQGLSAGRRRRSQAKGLVDGAVLSGGQGLHFCPAAGPGVLLWAVPQRLGAQLLGQAAGGPGGQRKGGPAHGQKDQVIRQWTGGRLGHRTMGSRAIAGASSRPPPISPSIPPPRQWVVLPESIAPRAAPLGLKRSGDESDLWPLCGALWALPLACTVGSATCRAAGARLGGWAPAGVAPAPMRAATADRLGGYAAAHALVYCDRTPWEAYRLREGCREGQSGGTTLPRAAARAPPGPNQGVALARPRTPRSKPGGRPCRRWRHPTAAHAPPGSRHGSSLAAAALACCFTDGPVVTKGSRHVYAGGEKGRGKEKCALGMGGQAGKSVAANPSASSRSAQSRS